MKVKTLEISNFRGISSMKLEFKDSINVMLGINGSGKTSILDLLAILLSRFADPIRSPKKIGQTIAPMDIKDGTNVTVNTITIDFDGEEIQWQASRRSGRQVDPQSRNSQQNQVRKLAHQVADELEKEIRTNLPIAVYYSVNRAVLDVPLRIRTQHKFDRFSAFENSLAGVRNDFRLFFEWYRNQEDIENEKRRILQEDQSSAPLYEDAQLKAVRKAIGVLSGFKDIRVRRQAPHMEAKKGSAYIDIRKLSDGEKCLLALAGDLARRLAIANPSLSNALEAQGIVLIDQVELHLHPQWQRGIVPSLQKTFQNCQFIITTHSPQVTADVKPENILILKDSGELDHPEDSYGWNTDSLLEDIFDTPSRPRYAQEKIDKLFDAVSDHNFVKAEEISQEIEQKYGRLPELIRARTLMQI